MGRGLHKGMVNAILPLIEAGRNHLLATYIITGFVASFTLFCQLKVLRRHKVQKQLKPTMSTPKD